MTIVDTVRGRLANAYPSARRRRRRRDAPVLSAIRVIRWMVIAALLGGLVGAASYEMRGSHLQAWLLSRWVRGMHYDVAAGQSEAIAFPKSGPYDQRFGYAQLPEFIASLTANRYVIDEQARWSPGLEHFVKLGGFPVYREKDQAGLRIFDRSGEQIYGVRFPGRAYRDFAGIPPLVSNTLMFIEDRYLLDPDSPQRNPAIEWNRFALAAAGRVGGLLVPQWRHGGGSTLATQIEKFRHSPGGLTGGVGEKMRQMISASARAYIDGPGTLKRRQAILTSYLDSTPLASMPGYGEIIGVPQALWIWFGTDYIEANKVLTSAAKTPAEEARKGEVYRQVLALLLSERRPSYYLLSDREALSNLTDKYLRALYDAGVIGMRLRDLALGAKLKYRDEPPPVSAVSYVSQKSTENIRGKLVGLLKLPDFYALDRLDLTAEAAVDTPTQNRVTAVLQRLSDRKYLQSLGMIGRQLLGDGDPAKVSYSLVLYERGADRNFVRVHADSLNKPFDINSDGKLMLGSTAKLRTMITYLDIVAELRERYAAKPSRELNRLAPTLGEDPLAAWAVSYLARASDRSLQAMLDAAMQRRYSASPGSFFTGGGTQSFGNFEDKEDSWNPTVEEAFQHSVNLSFVRLLRDIAQHYTAASGIDTRELFGDPDDPQRAAYLQRFADRDSRNFLSRFYKDYKGLSSDEAIALMVRRTTPTPPHLAALYMSMHPDARIAHLQQFLLAHLPQTVITEEKLWDLFLSYTPDRMSLADRGYVSGLHPLELWVVRYLEDHPNASWNEVLQASAQVRHDTYAWLFNGSLHKQDARIRILLEQDAFGRILENWRKTGYPFAHLVPSLGTAIGASGDRPDALADLMGTIMNDGKRLPTVAIEHLHFAANTPYQTDMSRAADGEQVMPVEVAQTVRRVLAGVVAQGTAVRLKGTYVGPDGAALAVGGKTGTGDNRYDKFGRGGALLSSRVVDRTATFVFYIGDRFFGTVTAYVPGEDAEDFHFTSALAVQLLKALQPDLSPLINGPGSMEALVGSSQQRN